MQELLNVSQAAKELGLSKRFMYQLVSRRVISCYRMGARILFDKAQIADFLARSLQPAEEGRG